MKAIPVTPITLPATKVWLADSYPSTGLYEVNGSVMAVYSASTAMAPCVTNLGSVDSYPLAASSSPAPAAPASVGLSESTFLKALAIAQQPELATKLL